MLHLKEKAVFFLPVVHLFYTVKCLFKKKKSKHIGTLAHDNMLKGVLASSKH